MIYPKKESWTVVRNSPIFRVESVPSLVGRMIRKRPPMAVLELLNGQECDVHLSNLVEANLEFLQKA